MNKVFSAIRKMTKTDIAAACLIGFAAVYLIFIAFTDGTFSDEAFYITIPMRLINGEGLFTDEWHLSQLSAVLTYLPVKLFYTLTGGTKGIILYMRLLFCIMQTVTGAVLYRTLRKEGIAAVIISITFMLYSVIALNTLSYNTMGVALLALLICTAYSLSDRPGAIKMLLCGALIAMFILCQPTGLVLYGIYTAAVCIYLLLSKSKGAAIPYPFTLKAFFISIAGILPVLLFFLYLLLKNSDISTVISCIPGILSDVEHMTISDNIGIETFSLLQFFKDMTMAAGTIPLILAVLCIIASVFIGKRNRNAAVIITVAGTVIFVAVFFYLLIFTNNTTDTDDINIILLPLALPGIAFYSLSKRKNHRTLVLFICTGFMYALLMTISSNLRLHASVNGYIIAAFGSILTGADLIRELKAEEEEAKAVQKKAAVCFLSAFAVLSTFAGTGIIIDNTVSASTYKSIKITEGIFAGIYLPSDQALIYTNIRKDAEKIKEIISPDDKLFVAENIPAMYLEGNFNMGAFSGWFIEEELILPEIRNRFRNYYEIFPENFPDYIYVPAYIYGQYGLDPIPPKMAAEFPLALFEGKAEDIGNGLLIKVTGIKDETD